MLPTLETAIFLKTLILMSNQCEKMKMRLFLWFFTIVRKRALTTLVFHAWSIFMNEGCYHQVFERLPLNWVYNNLCLATFSVHTGCSSVSSATAADGYKSANKSSGDVSCLFCSTTFWLRSVISPVELTHFTL